MGSRETDLLRATSSSSSTFAPHANQQQRHHLMRTGEVDAVTFDRMIEDAADAPRRHGLAPKSSAMFATDAERLQKRREYFKTMDTNNSGTISFDEWLKYAYDHIVEKVASL